MARAAVAKTVAPAGDDVEVPAHVRRWAESITATSDGTALPVRVLADELVKLEQTSEPRSQPVAAVT